MTQIVNGLPVTRARRALAEAVGEGRGRIYYEPAAKDAFDHRTGMCVTARLQKLLDAEWIRVRRADEPLEPGESRYRIHYRLTDYGRAALKGEGR